MRMLRWSVLFALLVAVLALSACTPNQLAKNFGGTMTKDLPAGEKLVVATWKEASLWYLTRPMRSGEVAERYIFQEDSEFGMVQGTVIFQEHPAK